MTQLQPRGPASEDFLKPLVDVKDADLEIVAVHGLNTSGNKSHAHDTWTAGERIWLRDFLPRKLPKARILLFGYNANIAFNTSLAGVRQQAENLLNRLWLMRSSNPDRPILFICHSLGGLVVKRAGLRTSLRFCDVLLLVSNQAIVQAQASSDMNYRKIHDSTFGLVFFATPHQGGNFAKLGDIAASIFRRVLGNQENTFMEALKRDSLFADDLVRDFRERLNDFEVLSFYETTPYNVMGVKVGIIVDEKSATIGLPTSREKQIGIAADHISICKFEWIDGDDYTQVEGNIVYMAQQAVEAVASRHRGLSVPLATTNQASGQVLQGPLPTNALTGTFNTNSLSFYKLTNNPHHLKPCTDSYWEHLTPESFRIYKEVYQACKDANGRVYLSAFLNQFKPPYPTSEKVRSVWQRLYSTELFISKNFTLAILYMLHVERYFPEKEPIIIEQRRTYLKRFDDWVHCACDLHCGRVWTFVNDVGLSRALDDEERLCRVRQWLEADEVTKAANPKWRWDYVHTLQRWKSIKSVKGQSSDGTTRSRSVLSTTI